MTLEDAVNAEAKHKVELAADRARMRAELSKRDLENKYKSALARIGDLETQVELQTALNGRKAVKASKPPKRSKASEATALLVLSDWHVEETIEPETVNGLNEFNLDIAAESIARTFERSLMLLEDARHLTQIRRLVVAVLGDLISGYIHEELQESNSLAPLPATMFAGEHLEAGLRSLVAHAGVDEIVVVTARGNHGRTTAKSRVATAADNSYEHNLYLHLARRFQDVPNMTWQISEGYHNWLDIEGHPCRFHHGDSINYWGGVGGLSIPVNKAVAQWNKSKRAAYDFFGHFHEWTYSWNWICNGSLVGYGPYSLRIKSGFQPPVQTFAVIDRERGMTRALPIFCR